MAIAKDGLAAVSGYQPNLVVLDAMMPGMDGLEARRKFGNLIQRECNH